MCYDQAQQNLGMQESHKNHKPINIVTCSLVFMLRLIGFCLQHNIA